MRYTRSGWLLGTLSTLALGTACANPTSAAPVSAAPLDLAADAAPSSKLLGWAALPQEQRTPGPTSGQFSTAANGVVPPFLSAQPIPGWSALLPNDDGTYSAMPDNGFGSKANSADYVLGYYRVELNYKTTGDGTTDPGTVTVLDFVGFKDSRGLLRNGMGVDLTITADRPDYYAGPAGGTDSDVPVDPQIARERLLTGYDFDIESLARVEDGTFWVGEEFGPYLLHFDPYGTLLDEPIPHPIFKSPDHPDVLSGKAEATLGASKGYESLAYDAAAHLLYAVTEAPSLDDSMRPVPGDERVLEIFEIDPVAKAYTGNSFKYRKEGAATENGTSIGDITNVGPGQFVLIERDNALGEAAQLKKLYILDLAVTDEAGIVLKNELVDLLHIADPQDIGGDLPRVAPDEFDMPFVSVECVVRLSDTTLAVAVDTNFPGNDGRTPGTPDDTEVIELGFDQPIASYAPQQAE